MIELIRTFYRYNTWANARIVGAAAGLPAQQQREPRGASFGSVHDTLAHILGAQWIWLSRWQGVSPGALPTGAEFPDLDSIRTRWQAVEQDTQAFVRQVTDEALARVVAYRNTKGERWAYPLWQQMLHQVNHATQHRSEVAMILTEAGHSPDWLDFLYFLDLPESREGQA